MPRPGRVYFLGESFIMANVDQIEAAFKDHESLNRIDSNVLIVDHNTIRYHTYDMVMINMLSEHAAEMVSSLTPRFQPMITLDTRLERAAFMKQRMANLDLSEVFTVFEPCPERYIEHLGWMLKCERECDETQRHITYTQLWQNISPALEKFDGIFVLRHEYESYDMKLPRKTRYFTTKNLFDSKMILRLINTYNINAVIIDSVEMAAILAASLSNVAFIFGDYRYNYPSDDAADVGLFRSMDILGKTEAQNHIGYGQFDPYPIKLDIKGVI